MVKATPLLLLIFLLIVLSACSTFSYDTGQLKKLTVDYSLEEAKSDACLVMENGSVTSGQQTFNLFLKSTEQKQNATIRIVNYYTIGDKYQYSEELFEKEKDKYPQIYITDIVYKDGIYTTYSIDDNKLMSKTYRYMIKDEFVANPEATFTNGLNYFLVNNENVTWDDIIKGMFSSKSEGWIDHFVLYQKLTYENNFPK